MYHLLVKYSGWASNKDSISASRVFENTEKSISDRFSADGQLNSDLVAKLPALFVSEVGGPGNQNAHFGTIYKSAIVNHQVVLEYALDSSLGAISNVELQQFGSDLGIEPVEFTRTHWSVKNVDLFKLLYSKKLPPKRRPEVFQLNNPEIIERDLVSVMMPFRQEFDEVYAILQIAAQDAGMQCVRADDIWVNPSIIQDVVSLIDRSMVVICDCTGRNPNVFYEAGIAHTLGKQVIFIAQSPQDIPFDVQHLRYVHYLNNSEGRSHLRSTLTKKLKSIPN